MSTLDQQKNIRKTAFMQQSLDDITRALFANLRGGVNEENESMKAAHTCPLCLSQLAPWFLGCFEEDGQQFERILWTCPKQETRQCYFPMNIFPLEIFWTRRSLEQMSKGIIPLPNLSLLPEQYHYLYPKLLPIKRKCNKRKPVKVVEPSSLLLSEEAIPSSSTSSISYNSDTSVGALLKDLHKSQQRSSTSSSRCSSLAVNTPMKKCRKLVDLNPNTSTALKTHKILSDENFGLDTEYVQNNTAIQHRRYIVNVPFTSEDVSHVQVINQQLRQRTNEVNELIESDRNIEQEEKERETRYISLIKNPSPIKLPTPIKTPIKKNEIIQRSKESKKRGLGESLNYRESERARSLSARFGIKTRSRGTKKAVNKRFELLEGIIPQCSSSFYSHQPVEGDFALLDSQYQEINSKGIHSSISSSSIECAESLATKDSERARRRKDVRKSASFMPTSSLEEQRRKEEERLVAIQTEETVRRKMELLLASALSRKNTKVDATTSATTFVQSVSKKPTIERSHLIDNHMELSGIPHDFQQDHMISTNAMISSSYHHNQSSELTPINYENESQNVDKFDIYDRCGTVMDIGNNDEFDFGIGLESEFINEGNNIGDGNNLMLVNDDSSFLEELSNR